MVIKAAGTARSNRKANLMVEEEGEGNRVNRFGSNEPTRSTGVIKGLEAGFFLFFSFFLLSKHNIIKR
jgi:hypothetical protein